jgi:predicted metal-dependent peptidase
MGIAEDRLADARTYMLVEAVYFSSALLNLIPYSTDQTNTLGVTPGMVMYYNPKYIERLNVKQVATRLWHETQHVLRDTFGRCKGVDHDIVNIGSDLAINSSGRHNPAWDFGPDGLQPARFGFPEDLSTEEYVELLLKRLSQRPQNPGCCSGQCGGMAGNSGNHGLEAQLDETIGRSEIDHELVKTQCAKDIIEHAKQAGTIPGGWKEWAEAILAPSKVPWQKQFHAVFRNAVSRMEAGADEYSLARPSRRTAALSDNIILPSLVENEIDLALCLDTSASMVIDREIALGLREAHAALLRANCETAWFLEVDTQLGCTPKRVRVRDLLKMEIHGRGGTDFRPAFDAAKTLKPKPAVLVYLTDGCGPAPTEAPKDMEVIWCLVGPNTHSPAEWGKVIRVTE